MLFLRQNIFLKIKNLILLNVITLKFPLFSRKRRFLIVSNYVADNQQSMIRFSSLMKSVYSKYGSVCIVSPPVFLTRLPFFPKKFKKYLAYIDKLIIFPPYLLVSSYFFDLVHIGDHSNAFYSFVCPSKRTIITCHDLLAVRAAMGDDTVACESSFLGPIFQFLVMTGLRHTKAIGFDSKATFLDYLKLGGSPHSQNHKVIHIPLNASFVSDPILLGQNELNFELPKTPYLLMVGSAQPRKNRKLALQLLESLGPTGSYNLIFAGEGLTDSEVTFKKSSKFGCNLFSVVSPSHELLNFLYCNAHALLFPSISEGFGWPLIEAQSSGCPVIASTATSIPEVAGRAALYALPNDVDMFKHHVIKLEDIVIRNRMISLGFENLNRFDLDTFTCKYLELASSL